MQGERSCDERKLGRSVVKALAALVAAVVTSTVPAVARADRADDAPAQDDAPSKAHASKASEAHGKRGKRRAHRAEPESRRAAPKRCTGAAIAIDRGGLEGQSMTLLDCHGRPREAAQVALSVLARPWGAQKPTNLMLPSAQK